MGLSETKNSLYIQNDQIINAVMVHGCNCFCYVPSVLLRQNSLILRASPITCPGQLYFLQTNSFVCEFFACNVYSTIFSKINTSLLKLFAFLLWFLCAMSHYFSPSPTFFENFKNFFIIAHTDIKLSPSRWCPPGPLVILRIANLLYESFWGQVIFICLLNCCIFMYNLIISKSSKIV